MAKTSVVQRNEKRKQSEQKYRAKREALKKAAHAAYVNQEIPWEVLQKLQKLPRNSHVTRIRYRCQLCGRPRGVYRRFGICRLCLRKYAMLGNIPGLVKSSW